MIINSTIQANGVFSGLRALGFSVFPIQLGKKKPNVPWSKYQKEFASADDIYFWDSGSYNVGVVCGSLSNLVVLDVDGDEAQKFVDTLNLPPTPCVKTAKGRHYYFKMPNAPLGNRTRINGLPLDLRGEGGYVVGPNSIHQTGCLYEWEVSPEEASLADIPQSLKALLAQAGREKAINLLPRQLSSSQTADKNRFYPYVQGALDRALNSLDSAKNGERNDVLFRVSVAIANLVVAAELDWTGYAIAFQTKAEEIGLGAVEAQATIQSAWDRGSKSPTCWISTAREWAYVSNGDRFVLKGRFNSMKPSAFNRMFDSQRLWEKGQISKFLLDNDLIDKVVDIRFDPKRGSGVYEEFGQRWLNTYEPSGILPIAGDATPFVEYLRYLIPVDQERDHLLKMISWTVRNPGHKLGHALLLRSEHQGIGKSMLVEIWAELLGTHNVRKTTSREITGDYQSFIDGKLLVVVEEVNLAFGKDGYNQIKDYITGTTVAVNEKHVTAVVKPNYATFVFLSNLAAPILIESTDRRFFHVDTPALPRESQYYRDFVSWWRSNLGEIRHHLEQIDLSEFDPMAPPPMTAAKARLALESQSPLEQEIAELIDDRRWPFSRDVFTLRELESALGRAGQNVTKNKLKAALQALGGISLGQVRVKGVWESGFGHPSFRPNKGERASLWAISNTDYWGAVSADTVSVEYERKAGIWSNFAELNWEVLHISSWPKSCPLPCLTV